MNEIDIIYRLVIMCIIFGIIGWIIHLLFICMSLKSKEKGLIEIYYNKYKELYPEIIIMFILIIFQIIVGLLFIKTLELI